MPKPSPTLPRSPLSGARPKVSIDLQLPKEIVRISQHIDGIELYFPPLRAPGTATALGLFGAACMVLPLLAASTLLAAGGNSVHGLLTIALASSVIVPFPVFGAVFIAYAVYLLANSLTVAVSPAAIRSARRVFGLCVRRREIRCPDVAAIEERYAAKFQGLFSAQPQFRLIARHATQIKHDVVVAENLDGETMMVEMRGLIAGHAGLGDRPA